MKKFITMSWFDKQEDGGYHHQEIINTNNIEKVYMVLPGEDEIGIFETVNGVKRKFLVRFSNKRECAREYQRIETALCGRRWEP